MLTRLAVIAALSGCSFVVMSNPSDGPRGPQCEAPVVVPVIDAIAAVAATTLGSLAALAVHAEGAPATTTVPLLGIGVGFGAAFAASSTIGFRRAGRCRRAIEARSIAIR